MNTLFILLIVIVILMAITMLILLLNSSGNKCGNGDMEGFSSYIQIRDTNNILPDADGNNLAIMKNIKRYKNIELKNKVIKGLVFDKSEMRLTNLEQLRTYTLLFNIEFINSQDNQIILCSIDDNGRIVYYVYINNNKLYINFKNETKKLNTRIVINKLYTIIIGFDEDNFGIYVDGEIAEINNKSPINNKNNIIFGGLKRNNKLLNPINAVIGNINLYKGIVPPEKIIGFAETCDFIPQGQSKAKCINVCQQKGNCDRAYCEKVCNECIDFTKCKWVPEPIEPQVGNLPEPGKPFPPKIKCFAGDSKIELRFKKPHNGNSPITSYLVIVKKSYKNDGFVKLSTIDATNCGESSCRYELTGLDNQDFYDVMVKSVNSVGMSGFSNVETLAPDGEIATKQISSALLETDEEIKKKVLNDFNYDDSNCEAKSFINYDEHVLDTTDKYSIDNIIKEAYVRNDADLTKPATTTAAPTVAPTAAPTTTTAPANDFGMGGYIPEYSNSANYTKAWNARTPYLYDNL
jgi:hypothetical protein